MRATSHREASINWIGARNYFTQLVMPDVPVKKGVLSRVAMAYRLACAPHDTPVSLQQAQLDVTLFRVRAPYIVPDEHRNLWLVEEAREGIALAGLGLRRWGALLHPGTLGTLAYQHLRLWLLLKAIDRLERAKLNPSGNTAPLPEHQATQ